MFWTILAIICGAIILSDQILPLEELKNHLNSKYSNLDGWKLKTLEYINHLFNCSSCLSFWGVFIIMGSIKYAIISYVLAAIIKKLMNTWVD